jgi:hypothetical protein
MNKCMWNFDGLILTWGKMKYSKKDLVSENSLHNAPSKISMGVS